MAGDEGARGVGDNLVKALIVEVGDVEYHTGVLHLRKLSLIHICPHRGLWFIENTDCATAP